MKKRALEVIQQELNPALVVFASHDSHDIHREGGGRLLGSVARYVCQVTERHLTGSRTKTGSREGGPSPPPTQRRDEHSPTGGDVVLDLALAMHAEAGVAVGAGRRVAGVPVILFCRVCGHKHQSLIIDNH